MKTLIDTNILVYAHDSSSSYQKAAAQLLARALQGRIETVLSVQNIAELYSVLTSPNRTGRPLRLEGGAAHMQAVSRNLGNTEARSR